MTPLVIIGGGLAGGAAACLVAQAGRRVIVLEREAAPRDKICGEFLSADAQIYLSRIGIDPRQLGARPITALRLVDRDTVVRCALPFQAVGLSRQVLDEAVLQRAQALGAEVRRGAMVEGVEDGSTLAVRLAGGDRIVADAVFLATGKRDLRGLRRRLARTPDDLVGFKMHFQLAPDQNRSLAGHVELILFRHGYAGLQLVDGARANLCLLVDRRRLQSAGGTWLGLLEDLSHEQPHLRARLAGAVALTDRPLSIFRVPYGHLHRVGALDANRIFRIGDQASVIPSFTGDGMAMALHGAASASAMFLHDRSAAEHHRQMASDLSRQLHLASALYRVMQSRPSRFFLMALARLWPQGMQLAATLTRVPPGALLQPGG